MPSGTLCKVTASVSNVVRGTRSGCRPSVSSVELCRWGTKRSSASRNNMPAQKPTKAGTNANRPISAEASIEGMIKLKMEAATMTPAAKPERARSTVWDTPPRSRNTHAAPSVVPTKGISKPQTTSTDTYVTLLAAQLTHAPQNTRAGMLA